MKPSRRREMAQRAVQERGMSIRAACLAFRISQACYRYEAKHQAENDEIADWLLRSPKVGALLRGRDGAGLPLLAEVVVSRVA